MYSPRCFHRLWDGILIADKSSRASWMIMNEPRRIRYGRTGNSRSFHREHGDYLQLVRLPCTSWHFFEQTNGWKMLNIYPLSMDSVHTSIAGAICTSGNKAEDEKLNHISARVWTCVDLNLDLRSPLDVYYQLYQHSAWRGILYRNTPHLATPDGRTLQGPHCPPVTSVQIFFQDWF